MSTPMLHSPADILAQLIVDLGKGTDPTAGGAWPVFVAGEPTAPDNAITVYDTTPQDDGRSMIDGEMLGHFGFQVRVRGTTHSVAYVKAEAVRVALEESVYDRTVHRDGSTYLVHCVAKTNFLSIGKDVPTSKRSLFTINGLVSLKYAN